MVKNPPVKAGDLRNRGSIPGEEDPLEEGMVTHSSFLPGESHGQRSLVGYSSWGSQTDTTEWLSMHACTWVCKGVSLRIFIKYVICGSLLPHARSFIAAYGL